MNMLATYLILVSALLLSACGGSDGSNEVANNQSQGTGQPQAQQSFTPETYQASYHPDYLPWPHHDPDYSVEQFASMKNELYVISGFMTYQALNRENGQYPHSGLDIYIPQGAPFFAVDNGTVVYVNLPGGNGNSVVVADQDNQEWGWHYVHIDNVEVKVGQKVYQGNELGTIQFPEFPHLHLNRVHRQEGNWQSFHLHDPAAFFDIPDGLAPKVNDELIIADASSREVLNINNAPVSGSIDLVIGIRDLTEYSDPTFDIDLGDRWPPWLISAVLKDQNDNEVWSIDYASEDLTLPSSFNALLPCGYNYFYDRQYALPYPWYRTGEMFMVLNNLVPAAIPGQCDEPRPIDTKALNEHGQALMPNGRYYLQVSVSDIPGNITTKHYEFDIIN